MHILKYAGCKVPRAAVMKGYLHRPSAETPVSPQSQNSAKTPPQNHVAITSCNSNNCHNIPSTLLMTFTPSLDMHCE
jgi:hypothetical protein